MIVNLPPSFYMSETNVASDIAEDIIAYASSYTTMVVSSGSFLKYALKLSFLGPLSLEDLIVKLYKTYINRAANLACYI